jgi:hypothetical protein
MTTFYQSTLRRSINETVYKKPVFELSLWGTTYWWTTKQLRIAGQEVRWSMIHGVQLPTLDTFAEQFQHDLQAYRRDHRKGRDLFLQIGVDMPAASYPTQQAETHREPTLQAMQFVDRDFLSWYDLRPTCREHMPHATIMLSTEGTMEERKRACSDSGKRMINKGQKAGLTFELLTTEKERRGFWHMWYAMSYDKWFAVISEDHFVSLMEMLTSTKQGRLFVAKKDDAVVSGSVCLAHEKQLIYLYGATDRAWGNIGAHYRLTMHIRGRARDEGFTQFDLWGIAEPWAADDHHLAGVTRFKQSFGGETIVYAGSFDCICSPRWYRAFKAWRSMKG